MKKIIEQSIPFTLFYISQYYFMTNDNITAQYYNLLSCLVFLVVNLRLKLYVFAIAQLPLIYFSLVALKII